MLPSNLTWFHWRCESPKTDYLTPRFGSSVSKQLNAIVKPTDDTFLKLSRKVSLLTHHSTRCPGYKIIPFAITFFYIVHLSLVT